MTKEETEDRGRSGGEKKTLETMEALKRTYKLNLNALHVKTNIYNKLFHSLIYRIFSKLVVLSKDEMLTFIIRCRGSGECVKIPMKKFGNFIFQQ